MLGQVTAGVLHDLGTQLGGILGEIQLALLEATPEAATRLHAAEAAARRAEEMRRSLLLFARGERRAGQHIDLNGFLRRTAPLLQRLIGANIQLGIELADAPLLIVADGGGLARVLLNLVLNAKDAIGRDVEDAGMITITAAQVGETIVLTVADDGCGMPPEVSARLFEPYFTTKGALGTGLGLVACRWLLEQEGGEISVESAEGQGTTVRVVLPAA